MTQPAFDPDFLLRPFRVTVEGFDAFTLHAASRGKALSAAWDSYNSARDPISFGEFMKMAKVARGSASADFGREIRVAGRRAFYVSWDTHYIQFALPKATSYSNTHPLDATTISGEPLTR
ncbi:hypothetical protein [Sphingomonas sp. 3-13AW]|uniref:hypothetical protein n=1 Tax=Sphingomonas sp. 3-13AW TaxID=3050450 RepID=UPI003BB4D4EA